MKIRPRSNAVARRRVYRSHARVMPGALVPHGGRGLRTGAKAGAGGLAVAGAALAVGGAARYGYRRHQRSRSRARGPRRDSQGRFT